ncbi:MAG TPA: GldG family protein [Burkholderiales bacterium]|nr:GldG family protein [Burkholderiales bacterium]
MNDFFRSGVILTAGIVLLAFAGAMHAILLESHFWIYLIAAAGLALAGWGAYDLRDELAALVRQRRGEIVLYTLGVVGVLCAAGYLSTQFSWRLDMTEEGRYSLSPQTITMLKRLQKPVHITFFHDPLMRETVELYKLMGRQTDKLTLEFYDPMLNPAAARLRGVQFAGTAILESEDRRMQINGPSETEIANAILRVSLGVTQKVCFLDGHREPDPFSLETHDHLEGTAGHTHGLGSIYETHQQHGMAKARKALETLNYTVEKISLARAGAGADLARCSLLVVAGPQVPLLPQEVAAIGDYLAGGGNGLFMLEPFVQTGLEPMLRDYGIVADNDIVLDESSHFWADPSAPAVTDYNYHPVAEDLPLTFYPGARSFSPTSQRMPGTDVIPLANSSKQSYGLTDKQHTRFDKARDLTGPLTIVVVASRHPAPANDALVNAQADGKFGKPAIASRARSRVAVIGDSDFATNSFFHIMGNGKLFLNAVNYLASKENLIGLEPRALDLPRVNLTNRQMKGTFFLAVILVPALLAAIGFAVWWKQR